jgi:hypothetical protein
MMIEDIASDIKPRVALKADFLLEPWLLMRFPLAVEWVSEEGRCCFLSQWLMTWCLVMHPVLSFDIDRLRRLCCQNWQFYFVGRVHFGYLGTHKTTSISTRVVAKTPWIYPRESRNHQEPFLLTTR